MRFHLPAVLITAAIAAIALTANTATGAAVVVAGHTRAHTGTVQALFKTTPTFPEYPGEPDDDVAQIFGAASTGTPTGTVTFYVCGPTKGPKPCTSKKDQVGSPVTVQAEAAAAALATSANFTAPPTPHGYWCFAAYYSGDNTYAAATDVGTDECSDVAPPTCSATVTKSVNLVAGQATSLPVNAVPSCFQSKKAVPATVDSVVVDAQKSSGTSLLVTASANLNAAPDMIVNFNPVIPGAMKCSGFTGSVQFSPALRSPTKVIPKETITGQATHCRALSIGASNSHVAEAVCWSCILFGAAVTGVEAAGSVGTAALATGVLAGLSYVDIELFNEDFGGSIICPSNLGTGSHFVTGKDGDLEFVLMGPPVVTGSFAGTDMGATSTVSLVTNLTPKELNTEAASKGGVKSIKIVSGTWNLK